MPSEQVKLTKALHQGAAHRLRPRTVVAVVAFAWGLAWQADRRRLTIVAVLGMTQSFGLGAGLLALRAALGGGLSGNISGVRLSAMAGGLLVMAVVGLVSAGAELVSTMQQQVLALKTNALACDRVTEAVAEVELRTFEVTSFHDRVEQAVWAARDFTSHLVAMTMMMVTTALRLLGVIGAVVIMTWWLLPVLVVATVPMIRVALQRQRGDFALRTSLLENRRLRDYLLHLLTGRDTAKEIRAFDLSGTLRSRLAMEYATAIEAERRFSYAFLWREIRARAVGALIVAGVVAAVLVLVQAGQITVATAIAALGGAYLLSGQLTALAGLSGMLGSPILFVETMQRFLGDTPTRPAVPDQVEPFTTLAAEHVDFSYPASTAPALNDVTVELRAGQVVALVGANGSGKTTLAKILTGLYRPDAGTLRWNGELLADPARLRAVATVLFQDFARYKLTAADNIGLGRPDHLCDHSGIERAAKTAGAHGFLAALPRGYDTVLSTEFSDGVDLSTGQWQRLALARAYFRDAPFIVLDEPTAALDPKAEADLFAHIRRLYRGRTMLLITHRFASIRDADHIYVMDHGRIIEHGTHAELMARDGTYTDLFLTQAAAYLDP
ncbi:ABC transporter ATP-binding protein [Nocardia transvalensis]|uniref:ABC transporter ATP-binding protein n=1 Tax=Nocardia transvalensis TaxID=37333 RepID=UPI001894D780|nr:ABC transporter ATP-binding protein [Nocardia transvalensis]MBF6331077.1 ABC transporter ATP-binding protein [Nocardia transvalensis]